MNFVRFSTGTTNIFPIANSLAGGQLVTEFNLKSRENVSINSLIDDETIGHSYVHAEKDFEVSIQTDSTGMQMSTYTLQIAAGRGVINGHYIESTTPVLIDLQAANADAKAKNLPALKGQLAIGLRVMYSTEATMAGAMLVENTDSYYEGIQIVILPKEELLTPLDVAQTGLYDRTKITCHLKLAEFTYMNGAINPNSIVQNVPGKCRFIDAERIENVNNLLDDSYVTKTGLDPKKIYTFSGKANHTPTASEPWVDSWCDSTDALMVWDRNPQLTLTAPTETEAVFTYDTLSGITMLRLPHKQVDGMTNTAGQPQYYASKQYNLPLASYSAETPGTVDKNYTRSIKAIQESINNFYRLPNGKQLMYIDILNDISELPALNQNWNVGDYIVVGQDNVVGAQLYVTADGSRSPSTMYVVLPGLVSSVVYKSSGTSVPSDLTGVEISKQVIDGNTYGGNPPNTTEPDVYNEFWGLPSATLRGQKGVDYFTASYTVDETTTNYYYAVDVSGQKEYSNAVLITGTIPLATTDVVGGFYNVTETDLDNGYVIRDDTGHLRLLDYALLRSGVLAYQLGQDYTTDPGLTTEEVQIQLDDYVNQRVAFPNTAQSQSSTPNVINVTVELVAEEEETTLNIYDIDSRFGTSVYLHILGEATNVTTINIFDCEKIRIDSNIAGNPVINLYRSCLYYDANIIDRLNIIQDMTLWYEKFETTDANLLVDNMTVIETDAPIIPEDMDFWTPEVPNDNHYMYALQSITFAGDGTIVGCSLYVKNNTTSNVTLGESIIVASFTIPQGAGLTYPMSSLTKQIKVTGSFVTAYPSTSPSGYIVVDTNFTAVSQTYDEYTTSPALSGSIAFLSNAKLIDNVLGIDIGTSIDGWEPNSFHAFSGGVIG